RSPYRNGYTATKYAYALLKHKYLPVHSAYCLPPLNLLYWKLLNYQVTAQAFSSIFRLTKILYL
ncbi:MAG TPA: hypothetical protein V6D12_22330, partial [Candidatus Obscuribacterales bacterium]